MIYKTIPLFYQIPNIIRIPMVEYGREDKLEHVIEFNWGYKNARAKKIKDEKIMRVKKIKNK